MNMKYKLALCFLAGIITACACISLSSCNANYNKQQTPDTIAIKTNPVQQPILVRSFKNSGQWDSLYLYSDGHVVQTESDERYFFISYTTRSKGDGGEIEGETWFTSQDFPTKNHIDSSVYASFLNKRDCYQNIIIKSIFEFKSLADYTSFDKNSHGDPKPKAHTDCRKQLKLKIDLQKGWRLVPTAPLILDIDKGIVPVSTYTKNK